MADDITKIKEREAKWQKRWNDEKVFTPKNDGIKKPFYMLAEFPFPSGTGLHGGHMLNYTGCDVMARFRRMQGYDVLYPLGFDSLGISAENYATKIGKHPADVVKDLIQKFTKNMVEMGWSIDLNSQVATSDPEFIKWTQWMFIQFFNAGLAYKSMLPMNWCPHCRTTLTNEELEDGKCNRCHGEVEIREKMQWNLAITKYAQRLLDDLALVDYPERVKRDQTNWIGKSTGADVDFMVGDDKMTVYTTRPDTIFGVTFCAIAPEHKLLAKWLDEGKISNADDVRDYIKASAAKSEFDRTDVTKEKTGVKLEGIMAKNPYTGDEIPVFVADYVLVNYAHGTIMAVPAHDGRDWDFAKKFGINIIPVIAGGEPDKVWEGDGEHINSGFMNGMNKADAIAAAIKYGEEHGFARPKTRFRMSDWGFSRQMYWGEPIPLVYCEKCGALLPRPYVENKKTGEKRIMKGFTSAYKRMFWDEPSSTLTQNFQYACSDNKIHPEQDRVLSLYEGLIIQTIANYNYTFEIEGKLVRDGLIRDTIGESVPPLIIDIICKNILYITEYYGEQK